MNRHIAFGILFGLACTLLAVLLMAVRSPVVDHYVWLVHIVPFILMPFAAALVPFELPIGIVVFVALMYVQWFVVGTATSWLLRWAIAGNDD